MAITLATAAVLAGVPAVTSIISGMYQSNQAEKAAKLQYAENERINRLNIMFAREENKRQDEQFDRNIFETRRQFNRNQELTKEQLAQNESQFTRSFGLQQQRFSMDKKQQKFNNRMQLKNMFMNTINNNHRLRASIFEQRKQLLTT